MTDEAPLTSKRKRGRAKGVPNRFTGDMKWAVLETFHQLGGLVWLKEQAQEYPRDFMAMLGKLLPKPLEVSGKDGEPVRVVVITGVPKDAVMTSPTRGTLLGDPTEPGRAGSS